MGYIKEFIAEFYEMRDKMEKLGENYVLKDSGERSEFDTGAVRDRATGKGRYDLLAPIAIRRVAIILEKGAAKYAERNWEKGIPLSRYIDSGLRHMFQLLSGDTEEDHAAQAMWNMMAFMWTAEAIMAGRLPETLGEGVPESLWKAEGPTPLKQGIEDLSAQGWALHCPTCRVPFLAWDIQNVLKHQTECYEAHLKKKKTRTEKKDLGSKSKNDSLKDTPDTLDNPRTVADHVEDEARIDAKVFGRPPLREEPDPPTVTDRPSDIVLLSIAERAKKEGTTKP